MCVGGRLSVIIKAVRQSMVGMLGTSFLVVVSIGMFGTALEARFVRL